jgi:superfamily II DNA or RNA helicase
MNLTIDKQCTLAGADSHVLHRLKSSLTMDNPAYLEAVRHKRWTGRLEKELTFWSETSQGFHFPRGFLRNALDIIGRGEALSFQDNRRTLPETDFQFTGDLRPYQQKAFGAIIKKDFGVLEALTSAGKTVICLAIIAIRRQPTLVLVHTKELLYQWAGRIKEFLGVDAGLIGDGRFDIQPVTVAIVNTAQKRLDSLPQCFGQLIIDECAHTPATTFSRLVREFDCKYMLGASATPFRRDGLTRLIHFFIGPVIHKIDSAELKEIGAVLIPEIITRQTDFRYDFKDDYAKMLSELTRNEARNVQIAKDILFESTSHKGTILVVSDRIEHCLRLADLLLGSGLNLNTRILTGGAKKSDRTDIVEAVRADRIDVLIATIQLIGEGFDCPGLSSLFLATPIKFSGRLIQVIGRILRPADGKKPRVYDYHDPVGPLFASAKAREKVYRQMGWWEEKAAGRI